MFPGPDIDLQDRGARSAPEPDIDRATPRFQRSRPELSPWPLRPRGDRPRLLPGLEGKRQCRPGWTRGDPTCVWLVAPRPAARSSLPAALSTAPSVPGHRVEARHRPASRSAKPRRSPPRRSRRTGRRGWCSPAKPRSGRRRRCRDRTASLAGDQRVRNGGTALLARTKRVKLISPATASQRVTRRKSKLMTVGGVKKRRDQTKWRFRHGSGSAVRSRPPSPPSDRRSDKSEDRASPRRRCAVDPRTEAGADSMSLAACVGVQRRTLAHRRRSARADGPGRERWRLVVAAHRKGDWATHRSVAPNRHVPRWRQRRAGLPDFRVLEAGAARPRFPPR